MTKKYVLTDETIELSGHRLHRIRSLVDIPGRGVHVGDLGGFIETELNLSHEGNCWVYGNSMVFSDAMVSDNAIVSGNAMVYGRAHVYENAQLQSHVRVRGDAQVYGNVVVFDNVRISGHANVFDNVKIYGNAMIKGDAKVYGDTIVRGDAVIYNDADICGTNHYVVFGPFGARNFMTFYRSTNNVRVRCEWFTGTIEDFEIDTRNLYHGNQYVIEYFNKIIDLAKFHFSIIN